jgi:DNA invertase Pin-like site-specific DNA recombinase
MQSAGPASPNVTVWPSAWPSCVTATCADGQSVGAQVRQLKAAGCTTVFREVASGAKTDRAQLRQLLAKLDAGDVVTVTRLDRLARSTRDLLNTLGTIGERKAGFRSLGDGLRRPDWTTPWDTPSFGNTATP